MSDRARRLVAALLLVGLAAAGGGATSPAAAQDSAVVVGRPALSVFAPDAVLVPGTETRLDLRLANEGLISRGGPERFERRVSTARATLIAVTAGSSPVEVRTGRVPAGSVPAGTTASAPVALTLRVPESAPAGRYELPVELTYTYTEAVRYDPGDETDVRYAERTVTRRTSLPVWIEHRPRFRIVRAGTDLAPGESGTVTLSLANVGTRAATEASVVVGSADPDLRIGSPTVERRNGTPVPATAAAGAGRWAPGEVRTVTAPATLARAATVRAYPLSAAVAYTDADGLARRSRAYTATVRPGLAPRFAVRNATGSLRVAEEGRLRGRLVNEGATTVRNAVVVLRTPGGGRDRTYALGDLAPGGGERFRFSVALSETADPGPRPFELLVRYEAADGRTVTSDPLALTATVAPRRDAFDLRATGGPFRIDADGRLAVAVTNAAGRPVRDVELTLNATDPLESDAPTAFVPALAAGESTTVGFALSVSSDAVVSTYPARITVAYVTPDGDRRRSGPHPVGVAVVAGEGVEPVLVGAVLLVVLVIAAFWWRVRG
jgi:hypothetical protein